MPKVKEIFKITKGKKVETTVNKPTANSVRYIQIGDLRNDSNMKYTEETELISTTEKDIVIAWDGAYAGLVGFGLSGIIGSTLAKMSFRQQYEQSIEPRYAGYFLRNQFNYLQKTAAGAAIPHVSKSALEGIEMTIPNLRTQQQIVAALDKAKSLIDKRQKSIELLDELLRATFLDMFGDPVSNPKSYTLEPISKFGKVYTGNTPPRSNSENYDSSHIEWIKTDNIEKGNIYLTEATEYLSEVGLKSGRSVDKGAVLVACIAGSLSSVGRCAIADRKVAFNQQINAIQPNKTVSSVFLYWLITLSSRLIQEAASKGMKKIITKSQFERIQLIFPDHNEQKKFENLAIKLDAVKLLLKQSANEIKTLFQSLLQRAFHGDLTFDIDLQLDAFLSNEDFEAISKDDVFIQRLIDRFNLHNQHNGEAIEEEKPFKFSSLDEYEKAKKILFNLMKENKVGQVYDKEAKKTIIEML